MPKSFGISWIRIFTKSSAIYRRFSCGGGHLFVSLYMPENPIGKEVIGGNVKDLKKFVGRYFEIEEVVKYEVNDEEDTVFILARKR